MRLPVELSALSTADTQSGPRLERLSPGEVALVTLPRATPKAPRPTVLTAENNVRWVPLREAMAKPNVRVLNAARSQGLAASARFVLLSRGWRKIAIGDATDVRRKSVVFYPKERAKLGRSLAAQFGVESRQVNGSPLVLVLGQDSIAGKRPTRRS